MRIKIGSKTALVLVTVAATLALACSSHFAVGADRPAAASEDLSGRTSLLVLPFKPLKDDEASNWIGAAIAQTLASDLSIDSTLSISSAKSGVSDESEALEAGRKADAQYVVFGTYQKVEDQIRITGSIARLETNKTIARLKATGALRDLFALEDTLTHQVQTRLQRDEKPAHVDDRDDAEAETDAASNTMPSADDAVSGDVFANAQIPQITTLGIRKGATRDFNDWDNADLDRLAFSDTGRAARTSYFYGDPYYAFPGYFGGYGSSSYGYGGYGGSGGTGGYGFGYSGLGSGYGAGYQFSGGSGYSNYRGDAGFSGLVNRRNSDTTAGYGNTAGATQMTLSPPAYYGTSRGLQGLPPVRQPIRGGAIGRQSFRGGSNFHSTGQSGVVGGRR